MTKIPPSHRVLEEAESLYNKGHPAEGLKKLRQAARRWPNDPYVFVSLGYGLSEADVAEAERCFTRAAQLSGDDPRRLISAASGMVHIAKWEEASRLADRIDALAPPDFDFQPELDHIRGCILAARGDPRRALPLLEASYATLPDRDYGRALLQVYIELEVYDKLQPLVEHALKAHTYDRAYLLDLRAWLIEENIWQGGAE